jgi:DNA-directed RNA polymerase II subunit RPB11
MASFAGGPMCNAPERYLCWRFEDEDEEEAQKLSYTPDSRRPNGGQFVLNKEDHTLGNLIRIQLLRDNKVRFAGYKVPHPLVTEAHVRVETMDSKTSPIAVFETALTDLQMEINTMEQQFKRQLSELEQSEV